MSGVELVPTLSTGEGLGSIPSPKSIPFVEDNVSAIIFFDIQVARYRWFSWDNNAYLPAQAICSDPRRQDQPDYRERKGGTTVGFFGYQAQ